MEATMNPEDNDFEPSDTPLGMNDDNPCDSDYDECDDDREFDEPDDSMDGDAESALASVGWGTDEDYGYYGDE